MKEFSWSRNGAFSGQKRPRRTSLAYEHDEDDVGQTHPELAEPGATLTSTLGLKQQTPFRHSVRPSSVGDEKNGKLGVVDPDHTYTARACPTLRPNLRQHFARGGHKKHYQRWHGESGSS